MKPKLVLNNVEQLIFNRLVQNKQYNEIAIELNISVQDVEDKVRSVFCLMGFEEEVNQELLQQHQAGNRLN